MDDDRQKDLVEYIIELMEKGDDLPQIDDDVLDNDIFDFEIGSF